MHCYLLLFYCFTSFIQLVVGAQNTFSTLYSAQNSFNNQPFENGKSLFFFVNLHKKVTHAQHSIPQVWHIKFDSLVFLMTDLRTPVHVLSNTILESIVICHIQIKVTRVLRAVLTCGKKGVLCARGGGGGGQALGCSLLVFAAGYGAASVAPFVLTFRVIACPSFLFCAAFGFRFGSIA